MTTPLTTEELDAMGRDYHDNADYGVVGSLSKCRTFIVACIRILNTPSNINAGGSLAWGSHADVRVVMERADRWLSANQDGGSVRHLDFSNVRS